MQNPLLQNCDSRHCKSPIMPKKYKPEPDWKPKTDAKTEKEEIKA